MYRLYGSPGSASTAPHCVLEEVGAPYEFVAVDISGEARDPEYLKLNPHGRVPTLVVKGRPVFEAAAICAWLADRHPEAGLAPANDADDRGTYLQWMMYLTNTAQERMLQMFYPDRCTSHAVDAPHVAEKALKADGPYLLGEKASAADIYLSMLAGWYEDQEKLAQAFPSIDANRKLLAQRPGMARGLAANG